MRKKPDVTGAVPGVNTPDIEVPAYNPPVPNRAWTEMKKDYENCPCPKGEGSKLLPVKSESSLSVIYKNTKLAKPVGYPVKSFLVLCHNGVNMYAVGEGGELLCAVCF